MLYPLREVEELPVKGGIAKRETISYLNVGATWGVYVCKKGSSISLRKPLGLDWSVCVSR